MALVLADRVKETSSFTGTTSPITLLGAVTGFQSFSAVGNGNTTFYSITNPGTNEWEVGVGTYTASGTTLSRTIVLSSSNSNLIVTFSAGAKEVFVTYPSEKSVNQDVSGDVTIPGTSYMNALNCSNGATFTGAGSRFKADFYNGTVTDRYSFQSSLINTSTGIYALPNGTSQAASWQATNNSDPSNAGKILIAATATAAEVVSGINGSGTYLPLTFTVNGGEVGRFATTTGYFGLNNTTPGSQLDVKGTLRLSGATSGYVGLAPAAVAGTVTYTLPSADGTSGQVLSTNGSATLSWTSAGGVLYTFSSTPPVSPSPGNMWVSSVTCIEYTYVNDGDSSQWVELGPGGTSGGGGASAGTAITMSLIFGG